MRNIFGRSAPIGAQVLLLVLFSVGVAQAVNAVVLLLSPRPERAERAPDRTAALLTGAEASGDFTLTTHDAPPADEHIDEGERAFTASLASALRQPVTQVRAVMMSAPEPPPGGGAGKGPSASAQPTFVAARQLPGGDWLWLERLPGWLSEWQKRTLLWLLLSAVLIAPAALLFARRFIRPVRAFAESAERIGADPQSAMMTIAGPAEIEEAAASFRTMQQRIAHYVDERTAMIGAIAHDLRTPLTRIAFRLEALPEASRAAAMRDIEEMQEMIGGALDFVKGEARAIEQRPVDLAGLLARAAEGLDHEDARIACADGPPVFVNGDAAALLRLLSNLLQNALRYGVRARAGVRREAGQAIVTIDDDGPGIPEADLAKVFEPFHRVDPSRNRRSGGTGLGLAIARSIATAHGGTLRLCNRAEGGLRAELVLKAD